MDEKYMTNREVMAYLSVGKNTLKKFRRLGLPFIQVDRKIFFRKEDVDRFMLDHLVQPHTALKPRSKAGPKLATGKKSCQNRSG